MQKSLDPFFVCVVESGNETREIKTKWVGVVCDHINHFGLRHGWCYAEGPGPGENTVVG